MTDRLQPFRLATTRDGGWYWRLVAANGETLAHSETYTTRTKALEGIASAIHNIGKAVGAADLPVHNAVAAAGDYAQALTIFEGEAR